VVAPPGLVAYWGFDEGSGTTAGDGAGPNTGALTNGPLWSPGRIDGGLLFDGVDDYVEVPDHSSLDITADLTLSAWIKPRSLGQNSQGRIIDKASDDGTVGYVFRVNSSNRIGFQQHGQTGGVLSADAVITLNSWQHVVVVVSGGTNVTFYVDGVNRGGGSLTGPIAANAKPLRIGNRHDGNRMFDGSIDEVRVFDRALTASEVTALYDQEAAQPLPPQLPTVTLVASPSSITAGGSSTLTWSSTDATVCASTGWTAVTTTNGSEGVSPTTTTTYTLTCTGPVGSATVSVTVTVTVSDPYYPAPESGGGWRSLVTINATPSSGDKANILAVTGIDWDLLKVARDYSEALAPGTVLVIRNGWVAGEWGSTGGQRVASVTKSFTGLAMAKLMDMSDAGQLAQTIGFQSLAHLYLPAAFGDSDPLKQQIRIEHLMTMSSGIQPEDPDDLTEQDRLTQPMDASPETEWVYSSLPPNLLSMILQGLSGQTLGTFFNSNIASAIGAAPLLWQTIDGGYTRGAAGADTNARDLARIAYLTMRNGVWDDGSGPTQVVSASRVATLTTPAPFLTNTTFRASPDSPFPLPSDAPNHYGHLWWTNSTQVALGASVPTDAYYMHGCLDDLVIVVPSRNLIVVRISESGPICTEPTFRSEFMQRVMAALVN